MVGQLPVKHFILWVEDKEYQIKPADRIHQASVRFYINNLLYLVVVSVVVPRKWLALSGQ